MPFIPISDLNEHCCSAYFPLNKNDVADVRYYMTRPTVEGTVKIGVKFTMSDSSQYGNIIEIQLVELEMLIKGVKCNG